MIKQERDKKRRTNIKTRKRNMTTKPAAIKKIRGY